MPCANNRCWTPSRWTKAACGHGELPILILLALHRYGLLQMRSKGSLHSKPIVLKWKVHRNRIVGNILGVIIVVTG